VRRAFTLIEIVLASAIGGLVIIACLSAMTTLNHADTLLARRTTQSIDLSTVHSAMRTAFLSLSMAPRTSPNAEAEAARDPENAPPPRLLLEFVKPPIPVSLLGEGRIVKPADRVATQRLELVLSQPPLAGLRTAGPTGQLRGAFELRPTRPEELAHPGDRPLGMSLWWRPMGQRGSLPPGRETMLMPGLVVCQWTVFADRERVHEFAASSWNDLPAYVELEVETRDGAYASWLFEVEATVEPETVTAENSNADSKEGDSDDTGDVPTPDGPDGTGTGAETPETGGRL